MLRIGLGVIGVGLIALGFSSDETLGRLFNQSSVAPVDQQSPVVRLDSGGEVQTTAGQLVAAAGSDDAAPQLVSRKLEQQAVESGQIVSSAESRGSAQLLVEAPISTALASSDSSNSVADDVKQTVVDAVDESKSIDIVPAVATLEKVGESDQGAEEPLTGALAVAMSNAEIENRNDTLFVLKKDVNLREGPSINFPIVLQMDKGQELMEFKRDGRWVHVGAYGTSGTIGWVHQTLVGDQP